MMDARVIRGQNAVFNGYALRMTMDSILMAELIRPPTL